MKLNEDNLLKRYEGMITNSCDLIGGEPPSVLFPLLSRLLFRGMSNDPEKAIREKDVKRFRRMHWIIATFGKSFLSCPQTIERSVELPKEPVIFVANHSFKDDTLASILAAKRHTYPMIGSLPAVHNTLDGLSACLNGLLLVNRKVKESRNASTVKALRALSYGADLLIFPEGVWNKSPNMLILDLWSGVYRIAAESGAQIVPIVHYVRDCEASGKQNSIHTVMCDPIRIDTMEQKEALGYLRDLMAGELFLLMEKYGNSTREEALEGEQDSMSAWEKKLRARVKTAGRYDLEIELSAHYRPRNKVTPESVWQTVADIEKITPQNALHVAFANNTIRECIVNDYQSRF